MVAVPAEIRPVDSRGVVIHHCLTMTTKATVRDLRNHFPRVRRLVEAQGEVLVTEKGEPKYRLTLYTRVEVRAARHPKDYMSRLRRHQPEPISAAAARALHEESRGGR